MAPLAAAEQAPENLAPLNVAPAPQLPANMQDPALAQEQVWTTPPPNNPIPEWLAQVEPSAITVDSVERMAQIMSFSQTEPYSTSSGVHSDDERELRVTGDNLADLADKFVALVIASAYHTGDHSLLLSPGACCFAFRRSFVMCSLFFDPVCIFIDSNSLLIDPTESP